MMEKQASIRQNLETQTHLLKPLTNMSLAILQCSIKKWPAPYKQYREEREYLLQMKATRLAVKSRSSQ